MSPVTFEEMRPGCYDPAARLADMDVAGIEASLNFPTFPRFAGQAFSEAHDRELGFACIRPTTTGWSRSGVPTRAWCPSRLIPFWDPAAGRRRGPAQRRPGVPGHHVLRDPRLPGWPSIHDKDRYWDPSSRPAPRPAPSSACTSARGRRCPPRRRTRRPAVQSTATFTNCMLSMCDWLFSRGPRALPRAPDRLQRGADRLDPLHPRAGRPRLGDQPGLGRGGRPGPRTRRPPTSPGRSSAASSPTGSASRTWPTSARTT